jgi:hypothetical protein
MKNSYLLTPKYEHMVETRKTYTNYYNYYDNSDDSSDENTDFTIFHLFRSVEIILECDEIVSETLNDTAEYIDIYNFLHDKFPDCYCGVNAKDHCGIYFSNNTPDYIRDLLSEDPHRNIRDELSDRGWQHCSFHWDEVRQLYFDETWVQTPFNIQIIEPPQRMPTIKPWEPVAPYEYAITEPLDELSLDDLSFHTMEEIFLKSE